MHCSTGSSPRVRGTHPRDRHCGAGRRIIPACAGNTRLVSRRTFLPWIIPACAGNTESEAARFEVLSDHPRVCGEHIWHAILKAKVLGSSPRVRGTRRRRPEATRKFRIIPACAGNTLKVDLGHRKMRIIPRVRGTRPGDSSTTTVRGSSPRVRGTLAGLDPGRRLDRIIPACAGNTRRNHRRLHCHPDHPRVCGEHTQPGVNSSSTCGSSPRVRGTRPFDLAPDRTGRIIPACAGNTPGMVQVAIHAADHPRVCGEHPVFRRGIHSEIGRIIPACAGNTSRLLDLEVGGIAGSSPRVRGTLRQLADTMPAG